MNKAKVLEIIKANVNVPGLMTDLIDQLVEPALDRMVKDTETPFDDMAKAALYAPLVAELKKLGVEKWDELMSSAVEAPAAPTA